MQRHHLNSSWTKCAWTDAFRDTVIIPKVLISQTPEAEHFLKNSCMIYGSLHLKHFLTKMLKYAHVALLSDCGLEHIQLQSWLY